MLIYETSNFTVDAVEKPLVTRTDGGHIAINPRQRIENRTLLSAELATELMYLTMLTGEAMASGLNKRGIDIGRINYQDNGNWGVFTKEGPFLHVHLYGRAKSAKIQKYGESCQFPFRETGFYDQFEALNAGDIDAIQQEIKHLLTTEKYNRSNWHI
ncbi:MAG: hypothetical protein KDD94_14790 [Calditrichaeota bacterium]|nr:hypothetical protein [Calditrichota bacterium]